MLVNTLRKSKAISRNRKQITGWWFQLPWKNMLVIEDHPISKVEHENTFFSIKVSTNLHRNLSKWHYQSDLMNDKHIWNQQPGLLVQHIRGTFTLPWYQARSLSDQTNKMLEHGRMSSGAEINGDHHPKEIDKNVNHQPAWRKKKKFQWSWLILEDQNRAKTLLVEWYLVSWTLFCGSFA